MPDEFFPGEQASFESRRARVTDEPASAATAATSVTFVHRFEIELVDRRQDLVATIAARVMAAIDEAIAAETAEWQRRLDAAAAQRRAVMQ